MVKDFCERWPVSCILSYRSSILTGDIRDILQHGGPEQPLAQVRNETSNAPLESCFVPEWTQSLDLQNI